MALPGTKTEYLVETAGNRYQAGAMRVKTIEHIITFDPEEGKVIAALFSGEPVENATPTQAETAPSLTQDSRKKLPDIASSIPIWTRKS